MAERFESRFTGYNNKELFFQAWTIAEPTKTIVVNHGLAEHSECYDEFATKMNQAGFNVYAWDLPGHGRSSGKRGYISDFLEYELDLRDFMKIIYEEVGEKNPIVMFGHSMGGLLSILHCLHSDTAKLSALCLSSPALGYAIQVSAVKDWLAKFSSKWLPTLTLYNEIEYKDLTHVPEKLAEYPNDSLRHDKVCAAVYLGMMNGFEEAFERADEIELPTLFQLAGQDKIVSTSRSKEFFEEINSETKQLMIYPDSYHEIFNDQEAEHCFKDLIQFIKDNT